MLWWVLRSSLVQHPNASTFGDRPLHTSDSDPLRTMIRKIVDVCLMQQRHTHWPTRGGVQPSDSRGIPRVTRNRPPQRHPPQLRRRRQLPHLSHPHECAAGHVMMHLKPLLFLRPRQPPRLSHPGECAAGQVVMLLHQLAVACNFATRTVPAQDAGPTADVFGC